ncbi:MAG: PilX N-terminal domain-containing pilus assembly protein [Gammaproteobacteria bacterium]|nr:PilX N-terminal domain-containing pilus assembly protein [Gammaproteobacteria bacterium]
MSAMNQPNSITRQRGAATLIVAIILLLALTLATFSAARIGVSEQRSVANDIRAKEAFWVAQAGVEQGIAFLNANKALISSRSVLTAATPVSPPVEQGWEATGLSRWIPCGGATAPPCGDGFTTHASVGAMSWASYDKGFPITPPPLLQQVSNDYTFDLDFLVPKSQSGTPPPVNQTVIVTATVTTPVGGDPLRALPPGTAQNAFRVSQMVKGYDTLVGPPGNNPPFIDAPLMVKGSVTLNANVRIWGNGDPDAPYKPTSTPFAPVALLSIWSRGAVLTPPASTCAPIAISPPPTCTSPAMPGPYYAQCVLHPLDTDAPPVCALPRSNTVPPAFPPDLFYYVFGVGNTSFQRVRNDATVLADCSNLINLPSGFYWVDGVNCTVTTNVGGTAARATAPITLVVNGGTFTLNAGVNFWGTVFLRGSTLALPAGASPMLHGALISDRDLAATTGNLDLVYDSSAFRTSSARAGGFAKVLGGWIDKAQ